MISDRIEALITHFCKGNKSSFAKKIGVTPSVIGNITGERKGNPSFEVIQKTLDAFASISPDWFILDRGPMLRSDGESTLPATPSTDIPAPSDTVVLRLMDKLDERETKIDQLQSELLSAKEELAALKAKYPEESADNPVVLKTAKPASTKKRSSQPDAGSATSANVPSK